MSRAWWLRSAGMVALGVVGCTATQDLDQKLETTDSSADVKSPGNDSGDSGVGGQDSGPACGPDPGNPDAGAKVDSGPKADSGSTADAGVFCHGTAFMFALTIPMPPNYMLAGFAGGAYEPGLVFVTDASTPVARAHPISRLVVGDMSLPTEGIPTETLYKPLAKTMGVVGPNGATYLSPWRLMQAPSGTSGFRYSMVSGSDGPNVQDRTQNLPALGPDTALSASDGSNDDSQAVRNGAEVYVWSDAGHSWNRVALLGADSSAWKGLAIIQPGYGNSIAGRYIFTQAKVTAGGTGIVEQYWPNALPTSAGPPTVVSTATDAIPVGVSSNGCELYAIRGNPGALSALIFRR